MERTHLSRRTDLAEVTYPTERAAAERVATLIKHGIWPGYYHDRRLDRWRLTHNPATLPSHGEILL